MQVKTKINSAVDILVGTICGDESLPWYNAKNNVFVNFINRFYKISYKFEVQYLHVVLISLKLAKTFLGDESHEIIIILYIRS